MIRKKIVVAKKIEETGRRYPQTSVSLEQTVRNWYGLARGAAAQISSSLYRATGRL